MHSFTVEIIFSTEIITYIKLINFGVLYTAQIGAKFLKNMRWKSV